MISLQRKADNGLFLNKGLKESFLRYCLIFNYSGGSIPNKLYINQPRLTLVQILNGPFLNGRPFENRTSKRSELGWCLISEFGFRALTVV